MRNKSGNKTYNKPFTDNEFKAIIKHEKSTAPEEDIIHTQMITKLPPETRKYLFDIYKRIWKEVVILNNWKDNTQKLLRTTDQ